ncbi:MAG: glycosyltransferase [Candidatus Auribacter fodinae]|jgi:glycosyltransferase involved in cell wall biosynthesis|uniref:Glycosyltransferase n=1 Tax=Candidatus Auribacter fodinae TaxID=2093366 RepID=A0A3A4R871_9BACT|nr:MAG: glycosyltransferase [Candidatus Auribacter fodinae]
MNEVKYSIIIPVYNAENTLQTLINKITDTFSNITSSYEIIMVEDCGKDNSWSVMNQLLTQFSNIKIIKLMKNYGQHNALLCGFINSRGEYVITIDDDLQHPPEEIPKLIAKMHEGYDIVYGVYQQKRHNMFRNFGSEFIQYIYKSTFNLSNKLTSFRIMTRQLVDLISSYEYNYTFIDGLVAWYTRNIGEVIVEHKEREHSTSNYTIYKLLNLAFNMITNFSVTPLRICSVIGFSFSLIGLVLALFYSIKYFFFGIPVMGYTSTIITITILSGIQLLMIGMIGEYLGRIHLNINRNPQFAIREIKEKK